ncbi:hypothetical protein PG997_002736 [Apiospora hydei]|uniref:Zn(2)-C6 fungal-type domain-containing protein n=1 Tax=Apiospora hydei TaxID=1337664 RepID=A0ABR1WX84_9PEZI
MAAMSLRRKSCDACYHGRRKCDRDFPVCGTCRRTKKTCHFAYSPITAVISEPGYSVIASDVDNGGGTRPLTNSASAATTLTEPTRDPTDTGPPELADSGMLPDLVGGGQSASPFPGNQWPDDHNATASGVCGSNSFVADWAHCPVPASSSPHAPTVTIPPLSIPNYLGSLGQLQRVEGSSESWQWVINELKRCPRDLATRGESLFMHGELYRDAMPRPIRAVLGVSAIFALLNDDNRQVLFRVVDAEVSELLMTAPTTLDTSADADGRNGSQNRYISNELTLTEELARLQALTLYQMMRMFGGGLEQRIIVEQQHDLLTTWAQHLLKRSQNDLVANKANDAGGRHHHRMASDSDWHDWLVAESIRRTVLAVYMFYSMYSLAVHGFCADFPTLAKLPVSASPESWQSKTTHLTRRPSIGGQPDQTLAYDAYTQRWAASTPRRMDPFEKFLIVPCKGLEGIAAYGCSDD